MDITSKKLIFNYLTDFKKKEISHKERAQLIQQYLDNTGKSIRALARDLDMPKSTVEDWLLWNKISKEKIKSLKVEGYTHTEIYKGLRNNKTLLSDTVFERSKLDTVLVSCERSLHPFIKRGVGGEETKDLIKRLQNTLNRILMYIDKE